MNISKEKIRCPHWGAEFRLKRERFPRLKRGKIKNAILFKIFPLCFVFIVLAFSILTESKLIKENKKENVVEKTTEEKSEEIKTVDTEKTSNVVNSEKLIKKSYEEIATEIIRGDYGAGEERILALKNLGYEEEEIAEIQQLVNIKCPKVPETKLNKSSAIASSPSQKKEGSEVATIVWNCMKSYGWNDIVCAGIMGNMMAEVGGQTFDLDYNSNGGCGYGLCQWTSGRRSLLLSMYGANPTIEQQIEYIYRELVGDGVRRQVSEAGYNSIMNAQSPEECALAFARLFERCGAAFQKRQTNARRAYEVFS